MHYVTIEPFETYDEKANLFHKFEKPVTLELEHSLISIQRWEQHWHVPFLKDDREKTYEEMLDYVKCMVVTPSLKSIDPEVFKGLTEKDVKGIAEYIEDPMTATWFSDNNKTIGAQKSTKEIVTAEIIYYWMITLNIPMEYRKWHLNSLLTLIKTVSIKNQPEKKMSQKEWAAQRQALNAQRRAKMHSKG